MSWSSIIASRRGLPLIVGLGAGAWLAAHACFWLWPGLFVPWELKASDRLFALRARFECRTYPCRGGVVHVDLTDSGLRTLPNRQVTRSEYARVVGSLAEAGARAQLFDFIFASRAGGEEDAALVGAMRAAGSVYMGTVFYAQPVPVVDGPAAHENPQDVDRAAWDVVVNGPADAIRAGYDPLSNFSELGAAVRGIGFLNLEADVDGVFRRVPLLVRYGARFFPSLALRAACDLLHVTPSAIVVTPGRSIRLPDAEIAANTRTDIEIPIDRAGNYRVNFVGPWEAFPHQSFITAWTAARDPIAMVNLSEAIGGRPVIVADIATGKSDAGPVPTDGRYPLTGVHATVLDNILQRSFVRDAGAVEMLVIEGLFIIAVTLVAGRLSSGRIAIAAAVLAAAYVAVTVTAFFQAHVILGVVRPLLMVAMATFAIVAYRFVNEEKARAVLRESFAAYFPPGIVDRIVRDPALVTASGRRKELTILFSDIKGFTTRCQAMTPDEIREFLNAYFGQMIEIVFEHGGTVDKFIGDGLMVFFGDPEDQPDHAERAVRSGLAMQRRVRDLSAEAERAGKPPIAIRIGISTGLVTVGNMGSARRLSYTVLGSDVNLAQRLEAGAPVGGILISKRTNELVAPAIPTGRVTLQVKGLDAPVEAYQVALEAEGAGR